MQVLKIGFKAFCPPPYATETDKTFWLNHNEMVENVKESQLIIFLVQDIVSRVKKGELL